jgi:hypothetical protein
MEGSWKPLPGQRIGVLLCGANTSAVQFPDPVAPGTPAPPTAADTGSTG